MASPSPIVLNPGEKFVDGSTSIDQVVTRGGFVLTTQRIIRVDVGKWSEKGIHTIPLQKIDAMRARIRPMTGAIVCGAVMAAAGVAFAVLGSSQGHPRNATPAPSGGPSFGLALIAIGVSMVLSGLARRIKAIQIVSGATTMNLNLMRAPVSAVHSFIAKIERTKASVESQSRLDGVPQPAGGVHVGPVTISDNARSRLDAVVRLHEQGVISDTEYEDRRRAILDSI